MARVKVELEIDVPDVGATDEQIEEWLMFELHYNGSMDAENPLSSEGIDADSFDMEFI